MTAGADPELRDTAEHLMRKALHGVGGLQSLISRDAHDANVLRDQMRRALVQLESDARSAAARIVPRDLGAEFRRDLSVEYAGQPLPAPGDGGVPPASLADAEREWEELAAATDERVHDLLRRHAEWRERLFKRRRTRPVLPESLWRATERLSAIHGVLPELKERAIAEALAGKEARRRQLADEIERRRVGVDEACRRVRAALTEIDDAAGVTGAAWADARWAEATPALTPQQRAIRVGELQPRLPGSAGISSLPALVDFPFRAGLAIGADVDRRADAIGVARSLVMRILAATPPGDVRFVFVDPVSLGQSVADFRHLAEFDTRLVDTKTWTSERDVEARLAELSDHLEVVISTYLRGQFDSIDEYNGHAGEVAEPYRVLVVFDHPAGFTARSARQLLSLIENGPRCGVHTILVHDGVHAADDSVPLERMLHSMQRIDLTRDRGRLTLDQPVGEVELDFVPDPGPPIAFLPDGRPDGPLGRLLLGVGEQARSSQTGPVTLARVLPILGKQVAAGRSDRVPVLSDGATTVDIADPSTWWHGSTATGACAPIGRAGANDVASLYFSSTEIAGGAIVVGLPRSGKSTALHASIVSLATLYSPLELELYLVDSKHGVEFKAYEALPHARLVSINSERELAVAVLQSLDREIKRRAELMKRRTTGKANITEYRAATGERLARVVLIMDEFHELFEEDDALGQQAFQAFSNIVRQGPFAGVHVVVASQTLSSMPAMDRATLSLLPMRVAFMCNESDADLVMGDANREVRALGEQGEGIFNPARGEPSHNKLFRGVYVAPDERSALLAAIGAKARSAGFDRRPRVFDGDTLAERPATVADRSAARPAFAVGEPFDLEEAATIALRRGRGANVVFVGSTDDARDPGIDGAVQSCVVDLSAAGTAVAVVDFVGDDGLDDGALDLLSVCETVGIGYGRSSRLRPVLAELSAEIGDRRDAADYRRPGRLLVLNGLQRAHDLAPADPYAEDDATQELAALLAGIVRDGPEVGCHVAVVVDGLAQFDRRLGRDLLKEFDRRVLGSGTASSDLPALTDAYGQPEVRHNQLLIHDHSSGRSRRARAYARHSAATLRTATERSGL